MISRIVTSGCYVTPSPFPYRRLDPQRALQEERVQLRDLEDHADERRLREALEGAENIPVVHLPAVRHSPPPHSPRRRELLDEPLRATRRRGDAGEVHPVVLASAQSLVDLHADPPTSVEEHSVTFQACCSRRRPRSSCPTSTPGSWGECAARTPPGLRTTPRGTTGCASRGR